MSHDALLSICQSFSFNNDSPHWLWLVGIFTSFASCNFVLCMLRIVRSINITLSLQSYTTCYNSIVAMSYCHIAFMHLIRKKYKTLMISFTYELLNNRAIKMGPRNLIRIRLMIDNLRSHIYWMHLMIDNNWDY